LQAAEAALDSSKATLDAQQGGMQKALDVPCSKAQYERAEQMYKDGVMSKSLVEDSKKLSAGAEQAGERAAQPGRIPRGRLPSAKRRWLRQERRWKMRKKICATSTIVSPLEGLVLSRDVNRGRRGQLHPGPRFAG